MKITESQRQTLKTWARHDCDHCGADKSLIELRRVIQASGHVHIAWVCTICERFADRQKQWVPRRAWELWCEFGKIDDIEAIPLHADYRNEESACTVCGKIGTQLHHYAPQSLKEYFGNVEAWPKGYLCDDCHTLWACLLTPWQPHVKHLPLSQEIIRRYYT